MHHLEPSSNDQLDGIKAARNYQWKQIWGMKWITLLIAGLMTTYVVQTGVWIPLLELDTIAWIIAMIGYFFLQISTNGAFITLELLKKQEITVDTKAVSLRLYLYAWLMWGIQVILVHWIMMVGYATLTMSA